MIRRVRQMCNMEYEARITYEFSRYRLYMNHVANTRYFVLLSEGFIVPAICITLMYSSWKASRMKPERSIKYKERRTDEASFDTLVHDSESE